MTLGRPPKPARERFARFFYVTKKGCWVWRGSLFKDGYGQFKLGGKNWKAHRAAWFIHTGGIPKDLYVLHKCNNRKCVNIKHLYLGDHLQNMRDKVAFGVHLFGFSSPVAKLTFKQVREIKRRKKEGEGCRKIAKDFPVCKSTINNVIRGACYGGR